ncbi:MAG: 2,3-diphosphoglycerate-dependent phosphoglycerate mutase [Oscillospiraceae bacterium]|jgi:2,3-bisphosphoglycerate-dependent phosphoglycerate mutase|nr:2,3-diphosphoglycerate-dependent phosphoglycerate mutase [Oscillospiraceae bacterium]
MKLVLVRHGESEWNRENRFTGWTDVELSRAGREEAARAGDSLRDLGYSFDVCHTSYLRRAVHTLDIMLDRLDGVWLPVMKTWRLNERHYGALQGLGKSETAKEYGEAQVKIWRRSYDVQPPALSPGDSRSPGLDARYARGPIQARPLTESLKDTVARAVPYFEQSIKPDIVSGKSVLVVAHGNSLRALVKHIDGVSDTDIAQMNIPTGIPLVYEFDSHFNVARAFYLGDESLIAQKMEAVANQGSAK